MSGTSYYNRRDRLGLTEIDGAKSDYTMAKRSGAQHRRRRGVPSQGAGADYHYRGEPDWLWMQELAWDMYRNDMVLSSIVNRVKEHTMQDGFDYDPQTGDKKLDKDQKDWWADVSIDPDECSPDGESVFCDQEEAVFLSTIVGGDVFGLPQGHETDDLLDGTVQLVESQMCRSPSRSVRENIVHGVEMVKLTRRRTGYWMLDEPINPYETVLKRNLHRVPAYYFDELTQRNERSVFHVAFRQRSNQTRGLTAFAPLFQVANYHDDIQFLELVRKRAAALFVFIRKRIANFDAKYLAAELSVGKDVTAEKARDEVEAINAQFREVNAGSVLTGLPGEELELNATNIPAPEHFSHTDLLLTFLGINLGFPLVMVTMDASQGSYSSIRGAVDMARQGFMRNQRRLKTRFHIPYMRFKILKLAEKDPAIGKLVEKSLRPNSKVDIFSHWWNSPKWGAIDPIKDASADLIRSTSMQESPRRIAHDRGREWSDIVQETIVDRRMAIEGALEAAAEINQKSKLEGANVVTWRDLAPLPLPERVTLRINENPGDYAEPQSNQTAKEQE
jgi:capsid protein